MLSQNVRRLDLWRGKKGTSVAGHSDQLFFFQENNATNFQMRFLGEKICWKKKPTRLLALGDDRNGFRAPSPSSSSSSSMIEWGTSRTRQNPQTGFPSLLTLSFLSPTRSIFLSYSNGGNLFRSAIAGFWPRYASECTKRSILMLFCVWRIWLKWVHGISKPCFLGTFAAAAISFKPSSSVLSVLQREKNPCGFLQRCVSQFLVPKLYFFEDTVLQYP